MAHTTTQGSSYNPSSSLPRRKYDVFLNFRGEDTRYNFTGHLFNALEREGFVTYIDRKLERGKEIGIELLKAIEESKIAVIVFSRNYATSKWCLEELVKIMECRNLYEQFVIPVFFHVQPSEVREQKGRFGQAFKMLEKNKKIDEDVERRWRTALREAAGISGWNLEDVAKDESKLIDTIVEGISLKLSQGHSNKTYPINKNQVPNQLRREKHVTNATNPHQEFFGLVTSSTMGNGNGIKDVTTTSSERDVQSDDTMANGNRIKDVTTRSTNPPKGEWTVDYNHSGVRLTLMTLQDGINDLKRLQFSDKLYDVQQAKTWWFKNKRRVYQMYNIRR